MKQIEQAQWIIRTLIASGYEAYLVGGYVRDTLIKKNSDDIDIATNALPETVKSLFPKTILTGLSHGTVTVLIGDIPFDVTTFRMDGEYSDYRKPDQVTFVSSLKEDILRRDFTMNALAMSVDLKLIDLVDGKKDIDAKCIRSVGEASLRFSEDALRMLRAIRFVSTLGFTIEQQTREAILNQRTLLSNISQERILIELAKMIQGDYFLNAIQEMVDLKMDEVLEPYSKGIKTCHKTKFIPNDLLEFLTFCAISGDEKAILNLPIPNYLKKSLKTAVEMFSIGLTEFKAEILFRKGIEPCLLVNKMNVSLRGTADLTSQIHGDYTHLVIKKPCDLAFKGDDLIELYQKEPGIWMSEVLDELCLKVLYREVENDYQKIRQYLLKKG